MRRAAWFVFMMLAFWWSFKEPAFAYWQFIERPAGFEVKPSARYASQKECVAALERAQRALRLAYPKRYPLVGSCEEVR